MKINVEYTVKMPNKRFTLVWAINEKGEDCVIIQTKTLQNYKLRHITETRATYSIESFLVIASLLSEINQMPEFIKIANRFLGNIEKNAVAKIYKNLDKIEVL